MCARGEDSWGGWRLIRVRACLCDTVNPFPAGACCSMPSFPSGHACHRTIPLYSCIDVDGNGNVGVGVAK